MAQSNKHTYQIDLNLSQQSKAVLKDLKASGDNINELNDKLNNYAQHGIDAGADYRKVLHQQADELEKQIKLKDDLYAKIVAEKGISEEQRKMRLQENRDEVKRLKAKQKELQIRAKIQKVYNITYTDENKAVKLLSLKIKAQEKLNNLLGKESKLRKGISQAAKKGAGVAKKVATGTAAAMGIGGIAGLADVIGSVDNIAEKEKALRALKVSPELADRVAAQNPGAGYTQIVDTLNKLSGKFSDKEDLVAAAIADIRFPGAADAYLADMEMGKTDRHNMISILEQIQKSSGSQDLSSAIQASLKARAVTTGKISRDEYLMAAAALQGIGVDDEQINRIVNRVASKGGDFVDAFNAYMATGGGLRGQQSISAQTVALDKIDYALRNREQSPAEKLQADLAKIQMTKERIYAKILPLLSDALQKLESSGFFEHFDSIITSFANFLEDISKRGFWAAMTDTLNVLWNKVRVWLGETLKATWNNIRSWIESKIPDSAWDFWTSEETGSIVGKWLRGSEHAQGGVVTSPSIVGEMGPELVLPLNNPERAGNIMTHYQNQNIFNINSNAVNATSLSQQISNNRFIKTSSRVF